jgi:hypothetical protein
MTHAECQRHFPFGPESTDASTGRFWYTVRCLHMEDRYVVEIRGVEPMTTVFVDYVQEGQPIKVEGWDTDASDDAGIEERWAEVVRRIEDSDPPRVE